MTEISSILFGSDNTFGIVAVEPGPGKAVIFRRADAITVEECPFSPWLLTHGRTDLPGARWNRLEGGYYDHMALFPSWTAFQSARYHLRDQHIGHLAYNNPTRRYLMLSGQTLFRGMTYSDVHRMQIDLETLGFSPEDPDAAIILIGITDNQGYQECTCRGRSGYPPAACRGCAGA